MTDARVVRIGGKVRAARLTDLAALGELSRLSQTEGSGARSLGLPVNGPPIGMFSLFRLPLVAFRPHDLLLVYEAERRVAGLVRVERENWRDDWTFVELDAIGANPGEIRYRLVQQVLREGQKRGAARFHVACADADDNVELFMQAGFARYGEEKILYRPPDQVLPEPWTEERAATSRIRAARPIDAPALMQLYSAVTPQPVQRLEAFRIPDWERQGTNWRVPRSSLAPILRFADIEAFVQDAADGPQLDAFVRESGLARCVFNTRLAVRSGAPHERGDGEPPQECGGQRDDDAATMLASSLRREAEHTRASHPSPTKSSASRAGMR